MANAANADGVKLGYIKETVIGQTPSGQDLTPVRFTSESLKLALSTETSKEITGDRQIADSRLIDMSVGGGVNVEWSSLSFADFVLAGLMAPAWQSQVTIAAIDANVSFSIVAATGVLTDESSSSTFVAIEAGDWLLMSGWDNQANNTIVKVASKTDNNTVVIIAPVVLEDETLAASGSANLVVTKAGSANNGKTLTSFTLQKEYTDLSGEFEKFLGCLVNQMNFNVPVKGLVTGDLAFMGVDGDDDDTSVGVGYEAESSTSPWSVGTDLVGFIEGGGAFDMVDSSIAISNNLRSQPVAGLLTAKSIGYGKCNVTANINAYFEKQSIAKKFKSQESTSLSWIFKDSADNYFIIDLPCAKLTDRGKNASGENTDIMLELPFQAFKDPALGYTIKIARILA